MTPTFFQKIADPSVKNVLLAGCGGGFDFLHGMLLLPELRRLGKRVILGSYSFSDIAKIEDAQVVQNFEDGTVVKLVTSGSRSSARYGPEVNLCRFLDEEWATSAPHFVYAYDARTFTVAKLEAFYRKLVTEHQIDTVVLIDGGSDSLMVGDEDGVGTPVEDSVGLGAVAALDSVRSKLLLCVGLGADRFHGVSDAASLRAIAELTAMGGFLGAMAIEPSSEAFSFYRRGIERIYRDQTFRSILTEFILASAQGAYGGKNVPEAISSRVKPGDFFLWPLMSMLWGFDLESVAKRSMMIPWIKSCETYHEAYLAISEKRMDLAGKLRPVENLPRHEEMVR